jgi:hypothetical protein
MPNNGGYKRWEQSVRDFLLVQDEYIIDLVPIMLIAHRLTSDPVWGYLVAPPGGSKTEFINSMNTVNGVHALSSLTAKTLVSGARLGGAQSASLLKKMRNGYIIIEDFTTLESQNRDEVKEIMGQLRSIYGGKFVKEFGTGETVNWSGKITLIAGATYQIYSFRELFANLGERFFIYQIEQPDRREASKRTMKNQAGGAVMALRTEMQKSLKNFVDGEVKIPEIIPTVDEKTSDSLLEIAEFVTRARSSVEREYRSPTKEIIDVHPPEMPTRFSAQLQTLAEATGVLNIYKHGEATLRPENYEMLYRVGFDSISRNKRRALQVLAKYEMVETAALAVKLNFPTPTVRRWLEDMNALEVLDRTKGTGGPKGDKWSIKDGYRETVSKFEHIKVIGGDYTADKAQEETGNVPISEDDDGFGGL